MYIKKNYFFKFNLFNFEFFHSYYESKLYLPIYNNIISIIVYCNRLIHATGLFHFQSVLHFET